MDDVLTERPSVVLPDPSLIRGRISLDTETDGLFTDEDHRVCVVSIAYQLIEDGEDEIWAHAFPFDIGNGRGKGFPDTKPDPESEAREISYNLPEDEWDHLLDWLIEAVSLHGLVCQNTKFDLHMVHAGTHAWGGVDLEKYVSANMLHDTMLGTKELDARFNTTSLKPTAARFWGQAAVEDSAELQAALIEVKHRYKLLKEHGPRYDLVPWAILGPYAFSDAVLCLRLHKLQMSRWDDNEGSYQAYLDECRLMRVLYRMERRGLGPYDVEWSTEIADQIDARIAEIQKLLPFHPVTAPRAAKYYFDEMGLAPWKAGEDRRVTEPYVTTKGKDAIRIVKQGTFNENVVKRLADQGVEGAELYGEYLKLKIINQMFYRGYANLASKQDQRIRTNFRQAHVKSGRLSVERFQAQALPKQLKASLRGEPLPEPRTLFKLGEGLTRVNLDLAQAELRLAAKLSDCQTMITDLETGADLHGRTTKGLFGIDETDLNWSLMRDIGKRITFGPQTVDTLIPVPDARGWVRAGDIVAGDVIYGRRGTTTVLETQPQGRIPIYRVTFKDGRILDVGALHQWRLLRAAGYPRAGDDDIRSWKVLSTLDLIEELKRDASDTQKFINVPLAEPLDRPDADLPVDPYLLGMWLGDGIRSSRKNQVGIAIHPGDYAHYEEQFGVPHRWAGDRSLIWNPDQVGASSKDLHRAWDGIETFERGSTSQRQALLQGLMDSDGTNGKSGLSPSFANADRAKSELVVRLVRSLGGTAKIYSWTPKHPGARVCHQVSMSLPVCSFRLARKVAKWRPSRRTMLRVESVAPLLHEEEAVCYRVDAPDSLYVAGESVVTHNSLFMMGAAKFQFTLMEETGIEWPLSECKAAIDAWRELYPEFKQMFLYWEDYATQMGHVQLYDNSKSYLGPMDYPSSGWNRRVQGSLALFVGRQWIPYVEKVTAKYDALVLTIHDSVLMDLPTEVADDVVADIREFTSKAWLETFGISGGADSGSFAKG